MTTTTDPDPTPGSTIPADATAAEAYLAEVRRHLGGLDEGERDDLLDDLVAHVHEVSAHDSRPLDEALGEPARFAAELLASAGMADRPRGLRSIVARASSRAELARGRGRAAVARVSPSVDTVRRHPWGAAAVDFLPGLRPAWWLARGWLLVVGFWLIGAQSWGHYALPELLGSTLLGVIAGVGCAVASVHFARSRPNSHWHRIIDVLAVLAAVALLTRGDDLARADDLYIAEPAFTDGGYQVRHADGSAISNIYAYDAAGDPIERIRLFDQDGRPIEVLDTTGPYAVPGGRAEVVGADRLPVRNVYPIEQLVYAWDPATGTESPRAIPAPRLSVPPLPAPTTEATIAPDENGTGASPTTEAPAAPDETGTATSPATTPGTDPAATESPSTTHAGTPRPGS